MKRVLIVSPHFPPTNAADHQRVRMALPYLREFGWEAVVLGVKPEFVEGMPVDPLLEQTIPSDVQVVRTKALPYRATRVIGMGNFALRAMPRLWQTGSRLLADGYRAGKAFDLVFFSTTQFPMLILGPKWKRKFGLPYVVDMQDPWLDDYYERTGTPPPGGQTRYWLSRRLAKILEPLVMRDVSHVISVSPSYVDTLRRRYPHLDADAFTVLPFGAPELDFELLRRLPTRQTAFAKNNGLKHWLYVGRGGHDMAVVLRLLFSAVAELCNREPFKWQNLRLHFVGTSYAPVGRAVKTVEPIATDCGIADIVEEQTARLPYFDALRALTEADALLVIGSDSPSYSASKLYPYMLSRKPMLSLLHERSAAVAILRNCGAGEVVTFNSARPHDSKRAVLNGLERLWVEANNPEPTTHNSSQSALNWQVFRQYTAEAMTRRMCEVFDKIARRRNLASLDANMSD